MDVPGRSPRQEAPTRRTASPETWAAALERARAHGLVAYNVAGDPRNWFVTSASLPGAGYLVGVERAAPASCMCRGSQFNDVCLHRALVLDRLGLLPRPRPTVVDVPDTAATPDAPSPALVALREKGRQARRDLYGDDFPPAA